MPAQSPVAWAIKRKNGSIAIEERSLRADGTIVAGGGYSLKPELHAEVWRRGPGEETVGVGGPLWMRKRDCQRFLWPGETAIRIRLAEEP